MFNETYKSEKEQERAKEVRKDREFQGIMKALMFTNLMEAIRLQHNSFGSYMEKQKEKLKSDHSKVDGMLSDAGDEVDRAVANIEAALELYKRQVKKF